jgi:ubiquinone/menaquinone biosynthesis C-methylase UbiE
MAEAYDVGRGLTGASTASWRDAIAPFLRVGGPPLLDLGAGTGRFSVLLASWAAAPVVALEPAQAMLNQARSKVGGRPVALVGGRAEAIPVRDGSVQGALLSNVVHHLDSLSQAADELARVVACGGHVLLRGAIGGNGVPGASDFALYRWFPGAGRFAASFPGHAEIVVAFRAAGLDQILGTTVRQVTATSLTQFYERTRTRADSTLAALDDDEFAAGLRTLEREAAAEATPTAVVDYIDFLVFRVPQQARPKSSSRRSMSSSPK